MAIYIYDGEIEITDARMIPVWIEHQGHRIKWHYREKTPTRLTKELCEQPVWHIRAKWSADGRPIHHGKWFPIDGRVRADNGWPEIECALKSLAPDMQVKFESWADANGPRASKIFTPVPFTEIA